MKNTLLEIKNLLDSQVSNLTLKGTHDEFHKKVEAAITPILNEYKLKFHIWKIKSNPKNSEGVELFSYQRDFKQDKRTSNFSSRGYFSNIKFNALMPEELSIEEALLTDAINKTKYGIETITNEIASQKLSIKNNETFIKSYERDLQELQLKLEKLQQ